MTRDTTAVVDSCWYNQWYNLVKHGSFGMHDLIDPITIIHIIN